MALPPSIAALEISTWYWLALSGVLVLAEVFIPSGIVIWLGVGAALVGLISITVKLTLGVKLLIWAFSSLCLIALWFKFFRDNDSTRAGRAEATLGYTGSLLREIGPGLQGSVRFARPILGEEVWECESDQRIAQDVRVRVVAVCGREGRRVKVMPV